MGGFASYRWCWGVGDGRHWGVSRRLLFILALSIHARWHEASHRLAASGRGTEGKLTDLLLRRLRSRTKSGCIRNYPLQQSGTSGCCNLEDDLGQPTWILLSGHLTPPTTPHVKTWMVSGRCWNLHSPTFFISDDDWRVNHRRYIIRISQVKVAHANRYEAVQCEAMQRT